MSDRVTPLRTGIQRGTGSAKRSYAAGGPAASKNQNGHYRINWISAVTLTGFHIGAIAALFFFSWKALLFTAILYWMTLSFGIGMGYHRLLTPHSSFPSPVGVATPALNTHETCIQLVVYHPHSPRIRTFH